MYLNQVFLQYLLKVNFRLDDVPMRNYVPIYLVDEFMQRNFIQLAELKGPQEAHHEADPVVLR